VQQQVTNIFPPKMSAGCGPDFTNPLWRSVYIRSFCHCFHLFLFPLAIGYFLH